MARKRRFLPVSFFGRSLLILLVPLLLLQVVSAFVFFSRHWEDVGRRLALGLGGDIAVLVEAIETYPVGPERDWIIDRARHNFEFSALWHEGEKLATMPGGISTATHFILKPYKELGVMMAGEYSDEKLAVSP